jgi:hypothetical protein
LALRKIFEPEKEEVTGGWRRLRNEELRDLYLAACTRCFKYDRDKL